MDAARTVRFVLDGREVTIQNVEPTLTVLEYLREIAGLTGTKEGCAEGDCGACTVVLGELVRDGDSIEYGAINSCIRFLATLDGKELITVAALRARDGSLHPVQRAMVDQHASQCGFCTPGIAMSLFALYMQREGPTRSEVVDALAGNLCRCTGYRPIIDAGCRMSSYPQPTRWGRSAAVEPERLAALRSIDRSAQGLPPLKMEGFFAPQTLDEACGALADAPNSLVLAGGTDVGLWVTKHLRDLPGIVYLGDVAELATIQSLGEGLRIGATVTVGTAWAALVRLHPQLAEQARRFASPPIRNSATLCGNVANGSPIGDSLPALIALGAEVELRSGVRSTACVRRLPLESFYLGYQKKDLKPGELVAAVVVPSLPAGVVMGSYKIAKRIDQDISAVCATFAVVVADGGVSSARLAYGGMAAVPARARHAESALERGGWNDASIAAAIEALSEDFQPLNDMRASEAYRMRTAGNLLRRFYLENTTGAGGATLRTHAAPVSPLASEAVR
jgi:xanthine dehydrogenase small subunit